VTTLTVGATPGIQYDVLYLANCDLIVALNDNVTADDLQGAVNVLLRLLEQRRVREEQRAAGP
jgi:hypothetical protein